LSGSSYTANCPRCGGKETIEAYSDWKPFDSVSGICLRCGFTYWTQLSITPKDELDVQRAEYDNIEFDKMSKEEKQNCEEFDKDYNIKEEKDE